MKQEVVVDLGIDILEIVKVVLQPRMELKATK